jgi:integrase
MSLRRERGLGRVFHHVYRDKTTGKWRRTGTWYIRFAIPGQGTVTEATGSTSRGHAVELLKQRVGKVAAGELVNPRADRTTLEDARHLVLNHYEINELRSAPRIEAAFLRLYEAFGPSRRVSSITVPDLDAYIKGRLAGGAARGTVNRELGALRRAIRLGRRKGVIARAPEVILLVEDNARQGFFERADFEAVCGQLPPDVQDVARFAYLTGWRRGEILTLLWSDVDREGRVIRLRREHSKTKQPRLLALEGDLWQLIERRWARRRVELPSGEVRLADHVFHRAGRAIRNFDRAWAGACQRAKVVGRLFHDLRRTAIRAMVRAGVDPVVAMKISGHRTRAVFDRYNIIDERDLREAVLRTDAYRATGAAPRTVVRLRRARRGR